MAADGRRRYFFGVTIADLKKLPRKKELRIVEELWTDLVSQPESIASPQWHGAELRETEKQFAEGKLEVLDWEDAKKELRRPVQVRVRLLRSALEDLVNGRQFYDEQNPGIGNYFFDSVFSDIDSLETYGGIHSVQFGFQRLFASHFPYAVYYRVIQEEVVVFRVLDCRQDPDRIETQLRKPLTLGRRYLTDSSDRV